MQLRFLNILLSLLVCAMGLGFTARAQNTFYVDDDAADDSGAGTNWATAKKTIQAAINLTSGGDTVLVSNGTYNTGGVVVKPLAGVTTLTNRVAITNAITVQAVSTNPADTLIVGAGHNGTNGPSAIRCVYMTNGATLSGFTLTNGHTDMTGSITNTYGGGVFCISANAIVTNCVIKGCAARSYGGGAAWGTFWNCTLLRNSVLVGGGGAYGSILIDCVLISNTAYSITVTDANGGGAYSSTLISCLLRRNAADRYGAAYSCTFRNCIIETNTATGRSGGIYGGSAANCIIRGNSGPYGGGVGWSALTNCLVMNNYGKYAGGVDGGTLYQCTIVDNSGYQYPAGVSGAALVNCIIASNYTSGVLSNYDSSTFNNCCTFPEPTNGANNITSPPGFIGYATDDFHLAKGSLCIDAGSNLVSAGVVDDLDGLRRPMWRAYDIGCYEAMPPQGVVFIFH